MAYANLILQPTVDAPECFKRLRDFVCKRNGSYDYSTTGIGWTLHDSYYAIDEDTISNGDWVVLYSPGETTDDDIYVQLLYSTAATWLQVRAWLYWNNSTHAGVVGAGNSPGLTGSSANVEMLWVYGDMDEFSVITRGVTYYYGAYIGKTVELFYDDTVAVSSAAVSSGSDITITLDAVPSSWSVGQNIWIMDVAGAEKIAIKTISGNDITADIGTDRASGCKLRADFTNTQPTSNYFGQYMYSVISHDGSTGGTNAYGTGVGLFSSVYASVNPDTMNDDLSCGPWVFHDTSPDGYYGRLKNVYHSNTTGKTSEQVFDGRDGEQYRYFNLYSNRYFLFKEV